jgi:hypothetical protein
MANRNRSNKLVVPGSDAVMNKIKNEVARELGFDNYDNMDKGSMPARIHGAIGGTITKRLVEYAQQAMANEGGLNTPSNLNIQEYKNDMIQDLQQ